MDVVRMMATMRSININVTVGRAPEPTGTEWQVGDRFRFTSNPGIPAEMRGKVGILSKKWVGGLLNEEIFDFYFEGETWNSHRFYAKNATAYCKRIPNGMAAPSVPATRTCSTCQRNADCGRVCWWCGSEEGPSR